MIHRHHTILFSAVSLVLLFALSLTVLSPLAAGQEETTTLLNTDPPENWDGVEEEQFSTEETQGLNRQITAQEEELDTLQNEIERLEDEESADSDVDHTDLIDELENREDTLLDQQYRTVEDLIEERTEVIEQVPVEGSPGTKLELLEDKRDSLETLSDYADDMLSSGSTLNDWGEGPSAALEDVNEEIQVVEAEQELAQEETQEQAAQEQPQEEEATPVANESDAPDSDDSGGNWSWIWLLIAGGVLVVTVIGSLRGRS